MITSMNQSELYKTLVGHYKPNYIPKPDSGKSEEKPIDKAEILKNAVCVKNLPLYKDISEELKSDRFVRIAYQNYDPVEIYGNNEIKEMPYEASDAIDFGCCDIQTAMQSGCATDIVTTERIAEFYGDMAKRLDDAYKEGKFTDSEYGELNEMIEKRVEKQASLTERLTASRAIGREWGRQSPEAYEKAILRKRGMTSEELMAEHERKISDYVERYFKIDRAALMEMFNNIRYGK